MTYVEFFDKTASENICACLTDVPDRVIFIGDKSKLMDQHKANYERVFRDRGYDEIDFKVKSVTQSNLDNAVNLLTSIIEEYDDCVFDITGGEEILNLALGIVYERYPEKNIQIHKFNLRNNAIYDCDKDGVTVEKRTPALSVEENIRIYGGDVVYGEIDEEKTFRWTLTQDFIDDVKLIWEVCKSNVRLWNILSGSLSAIEKVGTVSEDGLTTEAPIEAVKDLLTRDNYKYNISNKQLNLLLKYGLITKFDDFDGENVTITYKNAQVKKCLIKAGMALEMKVYITARSIEDKNTDTYVYNDSLQGVLIDWDGEVRNAHDTENEIDVILMHDVVPVFISCKNGTGSDSVKSEELYKLSTVAERFGSKYSKKVLITTSLKEMGDAGAYILQRATDMKIHVVDEVHKMSEEQLERKLRTLWQVGG